MWKRNNQIFMAFVTTYYFSNILWQKWNKLIQLNSLEPSRKIELLDDASKRNCPMHRIPIVCNHLIFLLSPGRGIVLKKNIIIKYNN